jgi:hypothetical protein
VTVTVTVTASVTLPAGRQTLTVDQDNGGWNLYYMAFSAGGGSTTNLALNKPVAASSDYQAYGPVQRDRREHRHLLGEHRRRRIPADGAASTATTIPWWSSPGSTG